MIEVVTIYVNFVSVCVRPTKTILAEISVSRDINSDAESVWKFFSDFNGLDKWVPSITASALEGDSTNNTVGAKRVLTFADGSQVHETLVDFRPEDYVLTYSIPGEDLGVRGYKATMSAENTGEGKSKFTWSASWEAPVGTDGKVKDLVNGLFTSSAEVIVKQFE